MTNETKKPIYKKWWVWLIAVAAFFTFIDIITPDSEPESPQSAQVVEQKQEKEQQVEQYDLSQVDYKIIDTEDVSIGSASRLSISVVINNNPATQEHIKAVSEKIVADNSGTDAISINYYFDELQLGSAYTLAQAVWAPEGEWSKADLQENQEMSYQFTNFVGETRTNEPTAQEREINTAMKDLWYEMTNESTELVTDEQVAEILAPQYGKSVEEMLEIRKKVSTYDLGL